MDLTPTDPPASSDATTPKAEPHSFLDDAALSRNVKRLSIDPAKRASHPSSPHVATNSKRMSSSPNTQKAPPSPMARSSSVMSTHDRAASPALSRRSSIVSLQGESRGTPRKAPSRRTSSSLMGSSPGLMSKSPLANPEPIEEAPPLTAAKVASDYFAKELALHSQEGASPRTIVILHDACYGHRFSRPKTTKSMLSMIVERPERIHAGVLGISTAYVRFGERHAEGDNGPHPDREPGMDLPFKIRRTSRAINITSPVVTNVHGTKWMEELRTMCDTAGTRLSTNGKELTRTEDLPNQPAKEKFHEGDLYLSMGSLDAFQGALGGVCDGVDAVFGGNKGPKHAFVCVRPPGHHCSADFPSGFCWLNNVHVGIEHAAMNHGLTHAAILDFDLHHGDGSQDITWTRNSKVGKLPKNAPHSKKTAIGYFSLHDINSYPCEYGEIEKVQSASLCIENAHNQTIWNVHLQPWKTEAEFWELYETRYVKLIEKARVFLRLHTQRLRASPTLPKPKAAIFLSAGFDASEWEGQGMQRHKVNVPTEFYARFTRDVVRMAQEEDLGVDGRIISVLEGGYSDRALTSGVLSHLSGLCDGDVVDGKRHREGQDAADDMAEQMEGLELNGTSAPGKTLRYNVEWWNETNLHALETMVYPAPPPPPKKPRTGAAPNFATPTQSFTNKVVDPTKIKSTSAIGPERNYTYARPPTPPPPEVDWITAAHELCKLLVPTDRQTKSFRPEELSEPRVKKEKMAPPPPPVASGRQLRDRKSKVTNYSEPPSEDEASMSRSESRSSRRQTIGDVPLAPAYDAPAVPTRSTRRQSLASEIGSTVGDRPSSRASSVLPSK
ncbi:Arginase/deacetylase, partial [Saccharata proteae CBS 121410]